MTLFSSFGVCFYVAAFDRWTQLNAIVCLQASNIGMLPLFCAPPPWSVDDLAKRLQTLVTAELEERKDAANAGVVVPSPPMTGN
jgi:hypothetical protein